MDFDTMLKTMVAGSALMALLGVLVSLSLTGMYLWALIDCINRKQGDERLKWVLVILMLPLVGVIIYFVNRGPKAQPRLPPPLTRQAANLSRAAPRDDGAPPFNIHDMQDPKKCAASINAALDAMSASRRQK